MLTPKVNFKQIAQNTKQHLSDAGSRTFEIFKSANNEFDKFVSSNSENINPKELKQVGLGALVYAAGIGIVVTCIKNIIQSLKKEIEEK